tara:strand:+ start:1159 stop:1839 length:681 start_codon:yes stop_codon:yes gene_type:complete
MPMKMLTERDLGMKNTIIFITGHTGVGKQTVGEVIKEQEGAQLIHNQLIAMSLFEGAALNGEDVPEENWKSIVHAFHKMADIVMGITTFAPPDKNIIFTNPLIDGDIKAAGMVDRLQEIALERNALFVPVYLECTNEKEHMERITSEGREKAMKLRNPKIAKRLLDENDPYVPDHPNVIHIDTAGKSKFSVAQAIIEHANNLALQNNLDMGHDMGQEEAGPQATQS